MPHDPRDPRVLGINEAVDILASEGHLECLEAPSAEESIMAVQQALEAMITLYGGARVAKWVRDLTFLIERKELP